MAAPKAPLLDSAGAASKEVTLEEGIFAAEVKPHLVHEAVRSEQNAHRAGHVRDEEPRARLRRPREAVAPEGHRPRPAGHDPRAAVRGRRPRLRKDPRSLRPEGQPQGGEGRAALRAREPRAGRLARTRSTRPAFGEPSTKTARSFLEASGLAAPVVLVVADDETNAAKSFRNLERVVIVAPSELEVSAVVWARSLLVSEAALPLVESEGAADAREPDRPRTGPLGEELRRHRRRTSTRSTSTRTRTRRRSARRSSSCSTSTSSGVNIVKVQAKPKRRGAIKGAKPGWKKAIVQLRSRTVDRDLRRSADLAMPVRRFKPTSPGPPLHDRLRLRRGDEVEAREGAAPRS